MVARWAASSSSPARRGRRRRASPGGPRKSPARRHCRPAALDRLDHVEGDHLLAVEARARPDRASTPAGSAAAGRSGAAGTPPMSVTVTSSQPLERCVTLVRPVPATVEPMDQTPGSGHRGPRHRRRAGPLRRRARRRVRPQKGTMTLSTTPRPRRSTPLWVRPPRSPVGRRPTPRPAWRPSALGPLHRKGARRHPRPGL